MSNPVQIFALVNAMRRLLLFQYPMHTPMTLSLS